MDNPNLAKVAVTIAAFLLLCFTTQSVPNTKVIQVLCNSGVYTSGDPFAISLTYVVEELVMETPARKGFNLYNISPFPNAFAFGHAACNNNLTKSDCGDCLAAAKKDMFGTCPNRIGARSTLVDCAIRYEQYPFTN